MDKEKKIKGKLEITPTQKNAAVTIKLKRMKKYASFQWYKEKVLYVYRIILYVGIMTVKLKFRIMCHMQMKASDDF